VIADRGVQFQTIIGVIEISKTGLTTTVFTAYWRPKLSTVPGVVDDCLPVGGPPLDLVSYDDTVKVYVKAHSLCVVIATQQNHHHCVLLVLKALCLARNLGSKKKKLKADIVDVQHACLAAVLGGQFLTGDYAFTKSYASIPEKIGVHNVQGGAFVHGLAFVHIRKPQNPNNAAKNPRVINCHPK
jgi:hypothetical protein